MLELYTGIETKHTTAWYLPELASCYCGIYDFIQVLFRVYIQSTYNVKMEYTIYSR